MIPASGAGGPEFDSRSGPNLTFLPVALTIATYLALLLLLTYHITHLPLGSYCTVLCVGIRNVHSTYDSVSSSGTILRGHVGVVGCMARNGHEG
jgi:hypothetical protein